MAKNSITDYSKTAASNTDIQSVDIDEGCLPSGINNAIRELMADLAEMNDGTVTLTSPSFAAATITGDLTVDTSTLKVDSTNNRVGIGTTSPSDTLSVNGQIGLFNNDGQVKFNSGDKILGGNNYGDIRILADRFRVYDRAGSNLAVNIDSSGNVGIGTSSPYAPLTVDTANGILNIANGNTSGGTKIQAWGATPSNGYLAIEGYTKEYMRIDSSGRVGIGTSSIDYDLHIEKSNASGNVDFLIRNSGTTSSSNTRILSYVSGASGGDPSIGVGITGVRDYFWKIDNSDGDKLKLESNGFTRMTVDTAGLVGIGNSSPDTNLEISDTSGAVLRLSGHTGGVVNVTPYDIGSIEFKSDDTSSGAQRVVATVKTEANTSSTIPGGELVFETCGAGGSGSLTERMRIDSSGNLLVGATSTNLTSGGYAFYTGSVDFQMIGHASGVTSGNYYIGFAYNGSTIGAIRQSGTTGISYSTFSDYRLKENVTGITDGIERVKQLNPSRFNFIADADTTVDGFLAHEAQTVVPEAVHGEKDAVDEDGNPEYQGIDQAKLVPLLTAALQEAITKIEDLEARVATLEGN